MTGSAEPAYSLFRWVADAQRDFAARADWGVTASHEKANHPPVVHLKAAEVTAPAGSEAVLLGTVSDPDGDRIATNWSVHKEASTVVADATIGVATVGKLEALPVTVPVDAEPGQRIVVLLTATDDGTPALTQDGEAVIIVR